MPQSASAQFYFSQIDDYFGLAESVAMLQAFCAHRSEQITQLVRVS